MIREEEELKRLVWVGLGFGRVGREAESGAGAAPVPLHV